MSGNNAYGILFHWTSAAPVVIIYSGGPSNTGIPSSTHGDLGLNTGWVEKFLLCTVIVRGPLILSEEKLIVICMSNRPPTNGINEVKRNFLKDFKSIGGFQ